MALSIPIQKAARLLHEGGIVAYPTEGVFGLGCLPGNEAGAIRICELKKRDPSAGLILIGATRDQLEPWALLPGSGEKLESDIEHPVTWVLPAKREVPPWIRGKHPGVAVRITAHPVAASLCVAVGSAIVSTSANLSGRPPVRNGFVLRRTFGGLVDYIVPGECGPAGSASEIRDFQSGRVLREAAKPSP